MKSKQSVLLFLVSYFAYAAIYIARLNLTVASPVIQAKDIMTISEIGIMGGVFFLAYSVGQLLNGILGDIFHPKYMVMTGLFFVALSNLGIAALPNPTVIILLWGINGFAQSMLWGPLLRTVSSGFSKDKRSFIAMILSSSIGIGSIIGIFLAASAAHRGNVKYAFLLPGFLSFLAFLCVLFFFHVPGRSGKKQRASLRSLFCQPQILLLMLPALLHGVLKDNLNLWMASYFIDTFAVDLKNMSFYMFLIPALTLAGRIVYPFLYHLCSKNEHTVSIAALSISVISLIPLCIKGISPLTAAICLSVVAAAVSIVNTSLLTIYPMHYETSGNVSTVAGVLDFATYLGAGVSSALYGRLLEHTTYSTMFISWIALSVLAILILAAVQKKGENLYEKQSNFNLN